MLIIAIPKSASTSLMATLSKLHSLPAKQVKPSHLLRNAERFPLLSAWHSDIRLHDAAFLLEACFTKDMIFKQHVPPDDENLQVLKAGGCRPAILLRDTNQVIEAYWRAETRGIHKPRAEFEVVQGLGLEGWFRRADEIGLASELELWNLRWRDVGERNGWLLIDYSNLLLSTRQVVNEVEAYFGLEQTKGRVRLSKNRYSREFAILRKLRQIT